MNLSGRAVAEAIRFFKLVPATDLLVIVDDLYLPVGSVRLREAGGSGGHNGLSSIDSNLGSGVYPRVRVGVGERKADGSGGKPANWDQADYVLSNFREDEWPDLQTAIDKAARAACSFANAGLARAMNQFNGDAESHRARQAAKADRGPSKSEVSINPENSVQPTAQKSE